MIFRNFLPFAVLIGGREYPSEPLALKERTEVVEGVSFVVQRAELPQPREGVFLVVPPSVLFQYSWRSDLVVPESMSVRVVETGQGRRICLEIGKIAVRALPSEDKRVYFGRLEFYQGAFVGTPNVERILNMLLQRNRRDQAVLRSATGQRVVLRISPDDLSAAELLVYKDERAAFPELWEQHGYADYGSLTDLCRAIGRYVEELYVDFEPIALEGQ